MKEKSSVENVGLAGGKHQVIHRDGRFREVKEEHHSMGFNSAKLQLLFQPKFQNVLQNNLKPHAFSRGDFSTRFAVVASRFWI